MNEQIEEMVRIINRPCREILNLSPSEDIDCPFPYGCEECTAHNLYNAGYQYSHELVQKIFADIEGLLDKHLVKANYTDGTCTLVFKRSLEVDIAELKKKYENSVSNDEESYI